MMGNVSLLQQKIQGEKSECRLFPQIRNENSNSQYLCKSTRIAFKVDNYSAYNNPTLLSIA